MACRDVVHGPGRRQIHNHDGIGSTKPAQDKVDDSGDCILLAVRFAQFVHEHQTVHIRIDGDPQVGLFLPDPGGETGKVFRDWLRSVAEYPLTPQAISMISQPSSLSRWEDGAARRIHAVDNNPEAPFPDHGLVDERKSEHQIDVFREPG